MQYNTNHIKHINSNSTDPTTFNRRGIFICGRHLQFELFREVDVVENAAE